MNPTNSLPSSQPQSEGAIQFSQYRLSNGLRVILHQDRKSPVVCLNIAYHVGSKNESVERRGFAHLFEHLLFDGSAHVERGGFDKFITLAGGQDNAYTTEDKTNYYEVLPSNQLGLGLWLESDRMIEFGVGELGLATQKNVVKEEKRERYDNTPYGSLTIRMNRLMYDDFPYWWSVIGDMDTIDAASLTDVRDFFDTYYVPSNAVLVLAGDFEESEARASIERYFAPIATGEKPTNRPVWNEQPLTAERRETVANESVPLPAVFFAYRIPNEGAPDYPAVDLLTDILSSGRSSRLYRKLVYELQIASDVGAFVDGREMPGLAYLYAVGAHEATSTVALEEAIDHVMRELMEEGVTERELTKALNKTESRWIASRITVQGKADQLAHAVVFFDDPNRANTVIEEYRAVTIQDIHRITSTYFSSTSRGAIVYELPIEPETPNE